MLKKIKIEKLFGTNEIDINFNEDITFLIGRNGSGKTTVINIIASLISGNIDFLTKYELDKILINYVNEQELREKSILINRVESDNFSITWDNIKVNFNLEEISNKAKNKPILIATLYQKDEKLASHDLETLLKKISKEFNNIYLPLSRETQVETKVKDEYNIFIKQSPKSSIDNSLEFINSIVKERQRTLMLKYETLNKEMQTQMFRESLVFDKNTSNIYKDIEDLSRVIDFKSDLIKTFKEMDMLTESFHEHLNNYFFELEKMIGDYKHFLSSKDNNVVSEELVVFMKNSTQVKRIEKWIKIVMERNKTKNELGASMESFFELINSYLSDSGKKITFNDSKGLLEFSTKNNKNLPIGNLSSGEKQIIIFFAYLILEGTEQDNAIFIVDEPELSLHLKWQQRFASDLLNVAPNLQLIFATHSPEMVGSLRNKIAVLGGDHA